MAALQKFGFKESPYERPQDRWVCGHLADGKPCALGPGMDGSCRVTTECQPRLEDGRWKCRRSPQQGGACEAGPLPDGRCSHALERCVPQPSLRTRRKRAALWATALAVGIVALVLGGGEASNFLMPGPLSASHANQTECQSCHAGFNPGRLGWLHQFVAAAGPTENSNLCLGCHSVGAQPFAPHSRPVEELQQMTAALEEKKGGTSARDASWVHRISFPGPEKSPDTGEPTIFCATCHVEHQGVFHDLKAISDARCQTCHVSKFGSFADSHPQFSNYPFTRRTRIIFDHSSHFRKHFPKAAETAPLSRPTVCNDCHRPGPGQSYMEVTSFETMCASCHQGDIMGATRVSGPKGIDFLAVPGLDVATLAERGVDIGEWPARSEAEPTSFLRLLLTSQNDAGSDTVAAVGGLDLLDLTDATDADLAKVAALAWSVKRLFSALEKVSVSKAVTVPGSEGEIAMNPLQMTWLTNAISHDVIMSANRDWFPNLLEDLQRHKRGEPTRAFEASHPDQALLVEKPAPAAATSESAGAAPAGDGALASGGDLLSGDGEGSTSDAGGLLSGNEGAPPGGGDLLSAESNAADGGDQLSGDGAAAPEGGDLLAGDGGPAPEGGDLLSADGEPAPEGGDLLAGDEGPAPEVGDLLAGQSAGSEADDLSAGGDDLSVGGGLLTENGSDGGGDLLSGSEEPAPGTDLLAGGGPEPEPVEAPQEQFDPEAWAESGGWYRQDFTIRYRPLGHADRFLRGWLDLAGEEFGTVHESLFAPVFDQLASPTAVGSCTKCHSVDDEEGYKNVKWHGFGTQRTVGRFTIFSHGPHIGAVGSEGCLACHQLSESGDEYLKSYEGSDASVFASNFQPVDKAICASCHTSQAAGEQCTLCHRYHATEIRTPLVETKLP